ncbi:MAG: valine--tRNA ligase [Candidatus Nanohaloarchaeota archaeon QJJ-7]|nr:valine--tRNA ligase [Candidatus Nanohaloarchaeota archaeon QJJ-7]
MPEGEYDPEVIEEKWQEVWSEEDIYRYPGADEEEKVFSIDTPPPTVSGSLHWGHVYGDTLQDFMARFKRMRGESVFFPFGYDNNGIATERLTERDLDIRHQDFQKTDFRSKVLDVSEKYEDEFKDKVRSMGFSMDLSQSYRTIEPQVQRISQLSFIDLYEKGREYRKQAPAIWCPECETAISQVETEDSDQHSHFNDIEFSIVGGDEGVTISTTRPELLPACVAVFVHPDDGEHQHLVGKEAEVPLFGHEVPILEDERVDMETGSGVVMSCTFGDQTDIEWYQAHDLDLRVAIDESGTMTEKAGKYEGLSTGEARKEMVEDLEAEDLLLDRRPVEHTVQVHERCDTPTEFLVTEQWYVELLDKKEEYLEAGKDMDWYPEKMFTRYRHWIEGLQWDWCISRQREFGIPFPVWYCEECGQEVLAEKEQLPVDPLQDDPPVDECPECGKSSFQPEEDVFDTWATSSLTPLINAGWDWDSNREQFTIERPELYPIDLRPQGHDIISFWLFHTVVKSLEHTGEVPFNEVMINGMVLDENREKMSKSKGNVIPPDEVLEEFPVDAARYWSAGSSVGDDLPFSKNDLRGGQKLMRKLWNASKLVEQLAPEGELERPEELDPIDEWMLAELDETVEFVTDQMEEYGFAKARDRLRESFWHTFCDNYLEISKQKLHDGRNRSTEYVLKEAHRTFLKLFAPFLSHITEEIWQDMYDTGFSEENTVRADDELASDSSIHREDWPEPRGIKSDLESGENAMDAIHALRKFKSQNEMAPTDELDRVEIYADISGFEEVVKEAMHIRNLEAEEGSPDVEEEITEIKLEYEEVGPKYGEKVSEMEADLDEGSYELEDGNLNVAGEVLKPEEFDIRKERTYRGDGDMLETDSVTVVVNA